MIGKEIERAAFFLRQDRVVAIPTETVYGLAANGFSEAAIARVFQIKGRPLRNPLIVHTCLERVGDLVVAIPRQAALLVEAFWPGPLTLLLEKRSCIPAIATAGSSTVAVRVPFHPLTKKLLEILPFPLVAPSANLSGYISPTMAGHVADHLGEGVSYILDGGPSEIGLESTIIGFREGRAVLYRLGSIPQEKIEAIVGPLAYPLSREGEVASLLSPGRLSHHYAPHTPLRVGELSTLVGVYAGSRLAVLAFDRKVEGVDPRYQVVLSERGSLREAAHSLFAAMHHLDSLKRALIIAPRFPEEGIGATMNERLYRASTFRGG